MGGIAAVDSVILMQVVEKTQAFFSDLLGGLDVGNSRRRR